MVKIEVLAEVIKQLPIIPWERKIIECEWGMNTDPTRMAILKAGQEFIPVVAATILAHNLHANIFRQVQQPLYFQLDETAGADAIPHKLSSFPDLRIRLNIAAIFGQNKNRKVITNNSTQIGRLKKTKGSP